MRISRPDPSLPLSSFSLLLSYILFVSLCAPFTIRKVEAASPLKNSASSTAAVKPATQNSVERANGLLALFRPAASEQEINTLVESKGLRRVRRLRGKSGLELLAPVNGQNAEVVASDLRLSPLVAFAEENYLIIADAFDPHNQPPAVQSPFFKRNDKPFSPAIRTASSMSMFQGASTTVIAVIDSGIDWTHPDLGGRRWINSNEQVNGQDDDHDGFIDDQSGWDFVAESSREQDEQGHGTAMAGLITAQGNNGTGSPGMIWQPSLMSLRVLDGTGTGDVARAIESFDYAVAHGAQVINCSWGTNGDSLSLRAAIERAAAHGVLVICSAGNAGRDIESAPRYPASFDLPNLIAVASTDNSDQLASWSDWSTNRVAVAAPGVDIQVAQAGGGYLSASGTSLSAAQVSGVAGMIKTLRSQLSAQRTKELILSSARQVPALQGKVSTSGVINSAGALALVDTLPPGEGLNDATADSGSSSGNAQDAVMGAGQARGWDHGQGEQFRVAPPVPTRGAPGSNLPNLNDMRRLRTTPPRPLRPIPATRCAPRIDCGRGPGGPQETPVDTEQTESSATEPQSGPVGILASNGSFPDVESLLGLNTGAVSDTPFTLKLSPQIAGSLSPFFAMVSPPPPATENVAWTNSAGVSISGNTLTKTATSVWGNSGANSTRAIASGDGYMEFTATNNTAARIAGLSHGDTDQSWQDVDFGIDPANDGVVYICESGIIRGSFGAYAAGDRFKVAVEAGVIKYYRNGTLFYTSTMAPAYPLLVDAALFNNGVTVSDAVIAGSSLQNMPALENIFWTNTAGVSVSGNTLTKTAALLWGNSGASSTRAIASGDGYMEFTATNNTAARIAGLSHGDTDQSWQDVDFGIDPANDGLVYVCEAGNIVGSFGAYAAGDRFKVAVEAGVIKYYRNGTLFYTSTVAPAYPLLVDAALYNTGVTVTDAVLYGSLQNVQALENVFWTNTAGVSVSGNTLTKTATSVWGNSGASSTRAIASGDGYMEFTATTNTAARIAGLSHGDTDQSWQDVDFGIDPANDGIVYICESGIIRGSFGAYAAGDRFRVAVELGAIKYYRNGTLFYTSTVTPSYPLLVDAALYNNGVTVTDAVLYGSLQNGTTASVDFSNARIDPMNRTGTAGEDMISGNYNWGLPLVGLKGRAGLDLGLSLSYNSLVWTKSDSYITYDADRGFPSPGFRLGFPTIQQRFLNALANSYAYLLITPSGNRVELRQVGTSNLYESVDSSYLQLTDYGNGQMLLRTTDGTRLSYALIYGEYRCTEIKDRNGNFITVNYDVYGHITTIIDTLARTITFNYGTNQELLSITQTWNGQSHEWATFGYTNLTLQTIFSDGQNPLTILGIQSGTTIPVLTQVSLPDGSSYRFSYSTWGQVTRIAYHARDGHLRRQVTYDLPQNTTAVGPQSDCPRFTERHDWAENWNGDTDGVVASNEEAVTTYSSFNFAGGSRQATMPDGTIYKESFATSGWQKGLTTGTEMRSGGVKKKETAILWTQDDINLNYQKNPRVTETNIYDFDSLGNIANRRRTTIDYNHLNYADFGLPYKVTEYAADAATVLRETITDYNLDPQTYLLQRIIGLVSERHITNGASYLSKTLYSYDAGGDQLQATAAAPTQHDAGYGTGFIAGRGNLTAVSRFDVTDINNDTKALTTRIGYDINGSVLFTRDPMGHQTSISYLDSFSDGVNPNTFAYPTSITDANNFSSSAKYSYDMGVVTQTTDQKGVVLDTQYDSAGRIQRVDNRVNNAWQFWAYPDRGDAVQNQTTIENGANAYYSITVFDGADRVRAQGGDMPNSVGLFHGSFTHYDVMGRAVKQSNPSEINAYWQPVGDDEAGWRWSLQTYDWKGRPGLTTNTDGTTTEVIYGGCGCAGGETVETRDEVGRRRKAASDVLGRNVKTEVFNADGSVYSTVGTTYNALDQVINARHYQGNDQSGVYRQTVMTYDGYGRLSTRKLPQQMNPTTYSYYADDQLQTVTDARGSAATYSYNDRHLLTKITYSESAGITAASTVNYTYDEAGNRTYMSDALGSTTYHYDQLSRMDSETRTISGVGTYTLNYSYNLAGQLASLSDPFQSTISYTRDAVGRVTAVSGSGFGSTSQFVSNLRYRAWGAVKSLSYGSNLSLAVDYNLRLQIKSHHLSGGPYAAQIGMQVDYQYHADASLKFAHDVVDERFDRAYSYDQAGRLVSAYTGGQARNYVNPTQSSTGTVPYFQSYQYNVWGEKTEGLNRYWGKSDTFFASYENGRNQNPSWEYDADGRVIKDEDVGYKYDAAGRSVEVRQLDNSVTNSQVYDGDGQVVKRVEARVNVSPDVTTTYSVRSSAMGGRVVAEVNSAGQKQKRNVYLGDEVLASEAAGGQISWRHESPLTGSRGESGTGGVYTPRAEYDAGGVNVGTQAPVAGGGLLFEAEIPTLIDTGAAGSNRCTADGLMMDCDIIDVLLNSGAAAQCWNNNCGPRRGYNPVTRQNEWLFFRAFADGYQGYVPQGAVSNGDGGISIGDIEINSMDGAPPSLAHASQNPSFKLYGPGFTDEQMTILVESLRRITEEDCKNFINDMLAKYNVGKESNSLDKLLNRATLGYYDVHADYTNTDLGVDMDSTIFLRDAFVNRGASAAGVGTHVFLSDKVFERSSSVIPIQSWNRKADTPTYIVHELFHVAGIDKSIIDSQQMTDATRQNCRLLGSAQIIIRH